jgi:hypothetical protein
MRIWNPFHRKQDPGDYSLSLELPADFRKFHHDNVSKLNREKVFAACKFLQEWIPEAEQQMIREKALKDPEWWTEFHFFGMMSVRNALRQNGFGEKEFGIDNLDDYAVGLVEVALGIVPL